MKKCNTSTRVNLADCKRGEILINAMGTKFRTAVVKHRLPSGKMPGPKFCRSLAVMQAAADVKHSPGVGKPAGDITLGCKTACDITLDGKPACDITSEAIRTALTLVLFKGKAFAGLISRYSRFDLAFQRIITDTPTPRHFHNLATACTHSGRGVLRLEVRLHALSKDVTEMAAASNAQWRTVVLQ
jgi:hypothetical protein